jgi:hypothetical protein
MAATVPLPSLSEAAAKAALKSALKAKVAKGKHK